MSSLPSSGVASGTRTETQPGEGGSGGTSSSSPDTPDVDELYQKVASMKIRLSKLEKHNKSVQR